MASSRTTSSRSARSQHDHPPRGGVNQPTRTNRTNRGSLSPPRTLFQVLVVSRKPGWVSAGATRGPPMGDSEFQSRLGPIHQGESVMRIRTPYITTLLTAGAAAVAIAAAPMATAAPTTAAPAPMQQY